MNREERFWSKVTKTNGCWKWQGASNGVSGYGVFYNKSKYKMAHRVAYELVLGPIPSGLVLDHLCRNRICVNPSHLEPVTHAVNIIRGCGPTAVNARRRECAKGHPFDAENTRYTKKGRECRKCHAIWNREWRARR